MDAATFGAYFEELVLPPALDVGFEPWGKSLWMERDGLQVGVLRTELRNTWPFQLTLVVRHDCLRDFEDRVPPPRSRNVSEYPVKAPPSKAKAVAKRYRYRPYNLGSYPSDMMDLGGDRANVSRTLGKIGRALAEGVPQFAERLTPEALLREIERRGEGAWAEARWIEDYRRFLDR
jgi:hypothetical protein